MNFKKMVLKNKKKIFIAIMIMFLIIMIVVAFNNWFSIEQKSNTFIDNEIVPEEEISESQLRETTVELYFTDANDNIVSEIRRIDSKELLQNPYNVVLNLLLGGSNNEIFSTDIPSDTSVKSVEKNGECLYIDFSKEFVENQSDNDKKQSNSIKQIVNTMTQFTEINSVKITIEGSDDYIIKESNINFKQLFSKEK